MTIILDQLCGPCTQVGKTQVPRQLPGDLIICYLCGDVEARDSDNEPCALTLSQWDELECDGLTPSAEWTRSALWTIYTLR